MKKALIISILYVLSSTVSFASEEAVSEVSGNKDTLQSDLGYFYGYSFGNMLNDGGSSDVDLGRLMEGLKHSLDGVPPALNGDRREAVFTEIRQRQVVAQAEKENIQAQQQVMAAAQGVANLETAINFLAENSKREEVISTPTGLQYEILVGADGPTAEAVNTVVVNYIGSFIDGGVFDQSGEVPAEFGLQQVISGWTEGLQLMSVGDKYKFYIHPDLAYAAGSVGRIPPNSLLIFEIELLDIK
jgi:FKBP-type peptidyl-prolyl cis-trans isomerase FkpA